MTAKNTVLTQRQDRFRRQVATNQMGDLGGLGPKLKCQLSVVMG